MKIPKQSVVILSAILCTVGLGGAGVREKTLVFCADGSPDSFNPQLSVRQSSFDATSRQLYDRLVRFGAGTAEVQPALAESWEVSEDGLRYVFRLRPGVAFHRMAYFTPTRPLNADDVVFTFNRQLDRKHAYHDVSGGRYRYFTGMGLDRLVRSVTRTDDLTVVFELGEANAAFPAILAMDFASILSAEYAAAMMAAGTPERLDREPVGTGPFRLTEYQRDALIRYEAHRNYWAGRPTLDRLVFDITLDPAVRYQKLRAGNCHVMAAPDSKDLPAMIADRNIQLVREAGLDIAYIAFNTNRAPLDDARVRRALSLAVDRQAIVAASYNGLGVPAAGLIPPALWSPNDASAIPAPDPDRARRLLAEAGATDFEVALWVMPRSRPYMPDSPRVAAMLADAWSRIGVRTRTVTLGWEEFLKRSMVREHDAILFGWVGETADPDIFLHPLLSCAAAQGGANRTGWCNRGFDGLLTQGRRTRDHEARQAIYRQVLQIIAEQAPVIPLAHSVSFVPVRKEVTGYRPAILGGHFFYGVDLQ